MDIRYSSMNSTIFSIRLQRNVTKKLSAKWKKTYNHCSILIALFVLVYLYTSKLLHDYLLYIKKVSSGKVA